MNIGFCTRQPLGAPLPQLVARRQIKHEAKLGRRNVAGTKAMTEQNRFKFVQRALV
jgi:hypothetical protein